MAVVELWFMPTEIWHNHMGHKYMASVSLVFWIVIPPTALALRSRPDSVLLLVLVLVLVLAPLLLLFLLLFLTRVML